MISLFELLGVVLVGGCSEEIHPVGRPREMATVPANCLCVHIAVPSILHQNLYTLFINMYVHSCALAESSHLRDGGRHRCLGRLSLLAEQVEA